MNDTIIKNLRRHIDPTPEETAIFLSLAVAKTVKRKEILLKEGDVARQQFFVINGCLRTYTIDANGKEHVLMFAPEDWWCSGDLYSFLSGLKSVNNLEALEPTTLLQISKDNLDILFRQAPTFERFFRILFQNAFVFHQNRINANLSQSAEGRYELFTKAYPNLESRISQKYIASYIGVTPEFFSQMKANMFRKKS
ncbi:Crp/Fnr family transcriptional regulator [Chitinophaga polysaccharea]|uniref:Crp/Fnr family transcriptional regulator n=1 Tax=Chitinophaga polysaccharea TaxID=1293035 RepID=UPI001454F05D|nr:Crp/Fnr family transcriptional regulator [Chitinophaga polysaccharea]NLR58190.1 Crp/Fnr family transcriptional regulator [Chitinophaga polysaccharea]